MIGDVFWDLSEWCRHRRSSFTMWRRPSRCADCSVAVQPMSLRGQCIGDWEWFMVTGTVWAAATVDQSADYLCIGCLEQRIGRELNSVDFTNVPLNDLDHPRSQGQCYLVQRSARLHDC